MAVFVQKDYNLTSQIELSQLVIRLIGNSHYLNLFEVMRLGLA